MWHVWGRGEVRVGFWWGDLRERDRLEKLGLDERIILKWMLKTGMKRHGLDCSV